MPGFEREAQGPVCSLTIESVRGAIRLMGRDIGFFESERLNFQNCHILSHSVTSAYRRKRLIPLIAAGLEHYGAEKQGVSDQA